MKLREVIGSQCGLRYCFDSLSIESSFSRRVLLDSEMMCTVDEISRSHEELRLFSHIVKDANIAMRNIKFRLQNLRDITGTLNSLASGTTLEDIEFFEIKHLAMLGEAVCELLEKAEIDIPWLEADMGDVIGILDPDGLKMASFYIYDSYSPLLPDLRKQVEREPDNVSATSALETEEERIRKELSTALRSYSAKLTKLLHDMARVDIALSKAILMQNWALVIPQSGTSTELKGMFNPEVKAALKEKGLEFEPVSFSHAKGTPSTIIGANMGGKTVALKTLTLCQYLYQFGFAVPAAVAVMQPFDEIHFCVGDEQSTIRGLSSFAAEMLRIDNVIKSAERGIAVLALIDEPARTTNPVEGTALVWALVKMVGEKKNMDLVITTHYNVENGGAMWKVKGLAKGKMDYALERTDKSEVPHEALNIAAELGIDSRWIEAAADYLDRKNIPIS